METWSKEFIKSQVLNNPEKYSYLINDIARLARDISEITHIIYIDNPYHVNKDFDGIIVAQAYVSKNEYDYPEEEFYCELSQDDAGDREYFDIKDIINERADEFIKNGFKDINDYCGSPMYERNLLYIGNAAGQLVASKIKEGNLAVDLDTNIIYTVSDKRNPWKVQ